MPRGLRTRKMKKYERRIRLSKHVFYLFAISAHLLTVVFILLLLLCAVVLKDFNVNGLLYFLIS